MAALAGAVLALAQAPFDLIIVAFASFPVLVWLLDGAAGEPGAGFLRRLFPAAVTGWWFGFGYFVAGTWWIGNALLVESDRFAWALPLAIVGLPAVLAMFHALACALARLLWSDGHGRIAALAAAFLLCEWLREWVLTGFPWNAIGYAAMPTPILMQVASVIGVSGMNGLAVLVFATPAVFGSRRRIVLPAMLAVILLATQIGYGWWRIAQPLPEETAFSARLVQPAIAQDRKWDQGFRDAIFSDLLALTTAAPADGDKRPDLVIWPETSIPFLLTERPDAVGAIADALQPGQMLFAGAVRAEGTEGVEARYYNAIYAFDDSGQIVGAADKLHLVPFGEYLPFAGLLRQAGLEAVASRGAPFVAASQTGAPPLPRGKAAPPPVCYEIIFPAEVDARGHRVMANVTNDAWYGDTAGPYQHLRQAQLRAVEQGVTMLRAANNGISAVIDPFGRITGAIGFGEKGAVDRKVTPYSIATQDLRFRPLNYWLIFTILACYALFQSLPYRRAKIDINGMSHP